MATVILDTQWHIDLLREAGVNEAQARAHVRSLNEALREGVATSADLEAVRTEIKGLRTEMKSEVEKLRTEAKADTQKTRANIKSLESKVNVLMWMIPVSIGLLGLLIASQNFF